MAFVSYFEQPAFINNKETFADMYENRLGKGFFPPDWQEAHKEHAPLPPPPPKPVYDLKLGRWITAEARATEAVYFL